MLADDIHLTTDADELDRLYERAKRLPDTVERLEILKKAYNLYRGRLFEAGEGELGAWAIPYATHYNLLERKTPSGVFLLSRSLIITSR